ncbi:LysR family transcriptional regulator [Corticibacter populi]|uniref:LysR family transcriptional regulator n=1 Tax=Corticibacter populi TaxID=1550736 RepID=A0A3M6QQ18_9BURK|nr:LysR family transcriptional regulator [Corticibacter populi]RMX05073.1 LysR family transcriptional regulator [Corticibacter populi]
MPRLDDLQVFVLAADAGSFSAAARQQGTSPARASAAVQRLERALGVRLFLRSTRSLRLSDDGQRYLPHARAMLAALGDGALALAEAQAAVAGPLRLSVPSDLGRNVLLPWLDAFQAQHPLLTLQVRISDQLADFFRAPLDAGIRSGALADSSLVALPLAPHNRRTLCAAPAYLARHGAPRRPQDLAHHNCLRFVMGEQLFERWPFHLPGGMQTAAVRGDRISDDADVVRRWAVAGHGLLYKSRLDVAADLLAGRLVELFPPQWGQPAPLHLVCADRSVLTPAMQQLHRWLAQCCAQLQARLEAAPPVGQGQAQRCDQEAG